MQDQTDTQDELLCKIRYLCMILAKMSGVGSDICTLCREDVSEILLNPESDFGEPHPEEPEYLAWKAQHEIELEEIAKSTN